MPSRILYDKRNLAILRCQAKPYGSAPLPDFETLCMSARVPLDQKEFLDSVVYYDELITIDAQEKLRIVKIDGFTEVKEKPVIEIESSMDELDLSLNNNLTISVTIKNTLEAVDNFEKIELKVNDIPFPVNVSNNYGEKSIEINEAGSYVFGVVDDRFSDNEITINAY
jgi:hypothetical protein